jgi:YVTN family beta-propeller protein
MKNHTFNKIGIFTAFLLACGACGFHKMANSAVPTPSYHLVKKLTLGGEGRWDYLTLDSVARRLYITRTTRVTVLDTDTGSVVGEIPNTAGVHGVAIAPELGRGFTSNGRDATATIFDLKTLQTLGTVKTGLDPDAIVYDPASHRVFTFNGKSNSATVFDAKTAKVLGNIELGGTPEFAVADGLGHVYLNIESTSEILSIDASSLKIQQRSPLIPCTEPTGISMDVQNKRLFIGCRNKMMAVVDAASGAIKTTLPIGEGSDATAFDPSTLQAFSSNGTGSLTVVQESKDKYNVVENVATQRGARTMALDLKTHNVFLATADFEPAPAPIPGQPYTRPKIKPGTFTVLIYGQK